MTELKQVTIFNQKLAGVLMQKGFRLNGMTESKNDSNLNVFFFTESNALNNAIQAYKSK